MIGVGQFITVIQKILNILLWNIFQYIFPDAMVTIQNETFYWVWNKNFEIFHRKIKVVSKSCWEWQSVHTVEYYFSTKKNNMFCFTNSIKSCGSVVCDEIFLQIFCNIQWIELTGAHVKIFRAYSDISRLIELSLEITFISVTQIYNSKIKTEI